MLRKSLLIPLALLPFAAHADDCRFSAERALDIEAAGLTTLHLDAGAGDLDIRAEPGLTRVEVRGRACNNDEISVAEMQLRGQRTGQEATVAVVIPEAGSSLSLFGYRNAYMDVRVRMPAGVKLDLRDSSGESRIAGLRAGLDFTDSSGDIVIDDVGGGIEISDSSGDIEARRIKGDITIRSDSSGDIDIAGVEGNVLVREDSSGEIDIRDVVGNAEVERDSSGDIGFDTIGGGARVGADGSGDIRASKVRGDFTVERKSNADSSIRHSGVGGRVSLPPEG